MPTNEEKKQYKLYSGRFEEAIAKYKGKVTETEKVTPGKKKNAPSIVEVWVNQGPPYKSEFRLRKGSDIGHFTIDPAIGASMEGGALRISPRGLSIDEAWGTARGEFSSYSKVAIVGEAERLMKRVQTMNGETELGLRGVSGVGQFELSPCFGASMSVLVGHRQSQE